MDDTTNGRNKAGRRLLVNLMAGLWGLATALALFLLTVRVQSYLPGWSVKVILCVFPFPVACGLAVGLVSPRRAIAWAPLWSGVFGLLLMALLSEMVRDAPVNPVERIGWMLAGTLVAAGAGWIGQLAAARSYAGRFIFVLVVACCLLVGAGHMLLQYRMQAYEREMLPLVRLEVDRDYIALPKVMDWECRRDLPSGSYVTTSILNGNQIRVFAAPGAAVVDHIEYDRQGRTVKTGGRNAIVEYLTGLGVREEFLTGLMEDKGGHWESVLRGTRLTLGRDGHLRIDGLPAEHVPSP